MAEERLGGSFTIDITNLKAGLQQANRLIRQSESEFRASAAGLDNWSKSEEGLTKRQKSLNSQIDIQKTKIAALIKEKERVIEKMKAEGKSQEDIDKAIDRTNKQITSESKQLDKLKSELDKTNRSLEELGDENKNAGKSAETASDGFTVMKGALADLVANGFRKAIDGAKEFAKSMITTAAEVKASNSQFEQAFGDLKDEAAASISDIAKSTGILETRLKATGAGIYSFARSSGASTEEAMELMQEALVATADSAAYYDRSLEDSAETLQSFLKGNFANDAALGVSATEFTRNAKAAELFGKKYNDLSEIEKQKTLLKMVTDSQKLSGAMGQAARESDGFENVMGNVSETWKQFQAKVGTPVLESLIPVIQDATKWFQNFQNSVDWDKFGKKVTKTLNSVKKTGKSVVKFAIDNFETLASVATKAVTAIVAFKTAKAATSGITSLINGTKNLITTLKGATQAQQGLNAAQAANVIGAVVSALSVLVPMLIETRKKAIDVANGYDKVKEATEKNTEATEEWFEAMDSARAELGEYSTMTNKAGESAEDLKNKMSNAQQNITAIYDKAFAENRTLRDDEIKSVKKFNEDYIAAQNELAELESAILKAQVDNLQWQLDNMDLTEQERQGILNTITEKQKEYNDRVSQLTSEEIALLDQRKQKGQISEEEYTKLRTGALERQKQNVEDSKALTQELVENTLEKSRKELEINNEDYLNRMHYFNSSQDIAKYYSQKMKEINDNDTLSWWEKKNAQAEVTREWQEDQLKFWAGQEVGWTDYNFLTDQKIQENTRSFLNWVAESKENGQKISAENAATANNILNAYADLPDDLQEQGKNSLVSLADGMSDEFPELKNAADMDMQTLIETMKNAIQSNTDGTVVPEAKKSGKKVVDGISEGLDDSKANTSIFSKISKLGTAILKAFNKSIDAHSPARVFKKAAINIPLGIALGIDDGTGAVVKSVKTQVKAIRNAYDFDGLSQSIDAGVKSSNGDSNGGTGTASNGGVVVYQTNNYSQAHSRYELYKSKQQTTAAVRLAMGTV